MIRFYSLIIEFTVNQDNHPFETYFYDISQQFICMKKESFNDSTNTIQKQSNSLEGECKIQNIYYFKQNVLKKYLLLPFLCLITCCIILAIIKSKKKLYILLAFDPCQLEQATHLLIYGNDNSVTVEKIQQNALKQKSFYYRKTKYDLNQDGWSVTSYKIDDSDFFIRSDYKSSGMSNIQYKISLDKYGYCEHLVEIPTLIEYLIQQLTGIFFILQYFICLIYVIQNFYVFALIMILVSVGTTILNYYLLRNSYLKIKQMAEKQVTVQVLRNSYYQKIKSRELVPGDLFIPQDYLPCDALLVQGQAYLNQASLTGQSIPIGKSALVNKQNIKETSWLYQGSKVLETRGKPLALVIHTGFITRKGRILRKILFKDTQQPQFFKYGFYFLLEVLVVCVIIYFGMIKFLIDKQIPNILIILRFFDMVGWVIPPTFPIYFNLCYSFSLYRLAKQNIFSTEPFKTIVSGKLKTMCFDKTGTLTQNDMKLYSVIRFNENNQAKQQVFDEQKQKIVPMNDFVTKLFATCHTVRRINNEMMGDQLDLRMFLHSGYGYIDSQDVNVSAKFIRGNTELEVFKINQFQSKFQSMSVIMRDKTQNRYYICVKGAPQKMYGISVNKPNGFHQLVKDISMEGLRSLAFGFRQINQNDLNNYLSMERSKLERQIFMTGIVTFENQLKKDTIATIQKLKQADIQIKMITGDNIYIGIETAIRAHIIKEEEKILVFQGSHQHPGNGKNGYVGQILYKQNGVVHSNDIEMSMFDYNNQLIPFAIDNSFLLLNPPLPNNIKIFARITPESKALIIKKLKQSIMNIWKDRDSWHKITGRTREKVGMTGDGANDIMAIKEADVGIGISQTDSSFAAHFSIVNMIDVQYIVREGRSTLMIIIEIFRYYGIISILKFTGSMILSFDRASYTDNQFTYFNYAQTLQIVVFLCLSTPSNTISKFIPNDNAMSLQNHLSFIGHCIISTISLISLQVILFNQDFFIANHPSNKWVFQCQSNTVIYLSSQMFFILYSIIIYRSSPWKCKIWKNYILIIWLTVIIVVNSIFFFITAHLKIFFDIVPLSTSFATQIFWITIAFILVSFIWETIIHKLKLHESHQ